MLIRIEVSGKTAGVVPANLINRLGRCTMHATLKIVLPPTYLASAEVTIGRQLYPGRLITTGALHLSLNNSVDRIGMEVDITYLDPGQALIAGSYALDKCLTVLGNKRIDIYLIFFVLFFLYCGAFFLKYSGRGERFDAASFHSPFESRRQT